jgi:Dullard-like phosphatase family protein
MNSKNSNKLSKKQKIQERISFFMNNNRSSKTKQVNNETNSSKYNENITNIFENYPKTEQNLKNSFPINKEVGKFAEPRFKITHFEKLLPKFYKSIDILSSVASKGPSHEITNSEIEMLEIDEKLPQKKLDQIESRRANDKIITNTFPFHFLIEIEKCYQEISKDLKGNGNKNLDYKIKIAATYLNILMNEENIIYKFFLYNKDMNKFFIMELCVFLTILFLNDFSDIKENDIIDLNNCITYSHLNFLFITMILVNKTNEDIYNINTNSYKTKKNNNDKELINHSYLYYQKCKTIIELNNDKIDETKLKNNFRCHNKIVKSILFNLLTNLSYVNKSITDNIFEIYFLFKKIKFIDLINTIIRNNNLINSKINVIIQESLSPEEREDSPTDESEEANLPPPEPPFLPPKKQNDKRDYCLVLDLDETLVHYFEDETESYVKVRLGAETFIKELSKYCEICIFTASTKYYADIVINGLDYNHLVDYRLYRQHTTTNRGINIKDLSKLGRNLEKIIIVDNIEENYQLQPNNGLNISDFEGDENDNELEFLLEDLLEIVKQPGKNVINELPKIRRNMQKRYTNLS